MMSWYHLFSIESKTFTCGYCNNVIASSKGYYTQSGLIEKRIYICPHCENPTAFTMGKQIPGVAPGAEVSHLPPDVESLYKESRDCVSVSAYTASVLCCRKLLMNIAVSVGADEGKRFIEYIDFLADKGYVPPQGRGWVDHIRAKGNEATHEIVSMKLADAEDLITFAEMLLKFIYEFPNRIPKPKIT